jgi:hypothetical protein
MKRAEIQAQLKTLAIDSVALSHKWTAAKATFDAAGFVGDGQTQQMQRDTMHAILDSQLDNAASVMTLTRKLVEADE